MVGPQNPGIPEPRPTEGNGVPISKRKGPTTSMTENEVRKEIPRGAVSAVTKGRQLKSQVWSVLSERPQFKAG